MRSWQGVLPQDKLITYRHNEFMIVYVVKEILYGSRLHSEGQKFLNVARDQRDVEAGKGQWVDIRNLHVFTDEMWTAIKELEARQYALDALTNQLRKGKVPDELLQLKMI